MNELGSAMDAEGMLVAAGRMATGMLVAVLGTDGGMVGGAPEVVGSIAGRVEGMVSVWMGFMRGIWARVVLWGIIPIRDVTDVGTELLW